MSSPHIPPLPGNAIVDKDTGRPTNEQALWQQQLAQSRGPWTPYTPTVTGLGGSPSIDAAYVQNGKTVFFRVELIGTSDGSYPTFTLPFAPETTKETFPGIQAGLAPTPIATEITTSAGVVKIALTNGSQPTNGIVYEFRITGCYEAA